MERELPHPNTLTIQLPTVFIGPRPTRLPVTVREFVLHVVLAGLDEGAHQVSRAEIAQAIGQAEGLVCRSGLRLALVELCAGTVRESLRLARVSTSKYVAIR